MGTSRSQTELENTRKKLRMLEEQYAAAQARPSEDDFIGRLTLRSLQRLKNQLTEEIIRFESRCMNPRTAASTLPPYIPLPPIPLPSFLRNATATAARQKRVLTPLSAPECSAAGHPRPARACGPRPKRHPARWQLLCQRRDSSESLQTLDASRTDC